MNLEELREELVRYGELVLKHSLATGAGGNISARHGRTMLISPSGFSLAEAAAGQYVAVDVPTGEILGPDGLRPSSEMPMHLACYRRRPDVEAVVHTHPQFTIGLTSSGHDLRPMFADAVVYLGRSIPHVDYVTAATPELAAAVEAALGDARAIVLRNHGAITLGRNLKQAFWRACTLEEASKIQLLATLAGQPRFLTSAEAEKLEALSIEQYRRELLAGTIN